MKASIKRFIWFFGMLIFFNIGNCLRIISHQSTIEPTELEGIFRAIYVYLPLFFFKDDKERKK